MTRYIEGQWHQRRQHIGLCFGTIFGTLYNPLLNFINYFTMKKNHHSFYILCQLFFHLDCLKCEFHLHPVTIAWNTYPSGCKKNHKFVCRKIEAVFLHAGFYSRQPFYLCIYISTLLCAVMTHLSASTALCVDGQKRHARGDHHYVMLFLCCNIYVSIVCWFIFISFSLASAIPML